LSKQVATRVSKAEYEHIRRLVRYGLYINSSEFVRDAMRRRLAELGSSTRISTSRLKQELREYLKDHGGFIWPDQAANDLGYSVLDILEALKKLKKEGRAVETKNTRIDA